MSTHRHTFIIAALIVLIGNVLAVGDWKEDAKAIDISGGEDHTLVLTKNKWPWACGDNYYYQLGIGSNVSKWTLVRVAKGDMNSPSDSLENIDDVDAGWTHSLALDVNNFVWAWGRNAEGQLGDGFQLPRATPVRVKSGEQDPNHPDSFLQYVAAISAGRSGEHSLAVDVNNLVYAWGRNQEGQCGNGESGNFVKDFA
jgi:alpha-tubulin suppressor-like RCC1 family protein